MRRAPRLRLLVLCLLAIASAGCACRMHCGRAREDLAGLLPMLAEHPLAPSQNISLTELGRTQTESVHLVQIRHQEQLHIHQQHDGVAILLRGHGHLRLAAQTILMRPGSVVVIPRGVPHAFTNESNRPAVALAVFSPPLVRPDVVPVDQGRR